MKSIIEELWNGERGPQDTLVNNNPHYKELQQLQSRNKTELLESLSIFCLRTCRDYSLTKGGKLSSLSSPRLGNWGILLNGVLLTAQTSVSPRIGSECTLSDILIADCPAKYILSEEAHIRILSSLFPDAKVSVYIPPMEPPYV